jgi:hypothetical protein
VRKDRCAAALDLPLGLFSAFIHNADADIDMRISPLKIQHRRFEADNYVAVDMDVTVMAEGRHTPEQYSGQGR